MDTTYEVRIWTTEVWRGKQKITYWVRWKVGSQRFKKPFTTRALADSFRSDLISAARQGQAFRLSDGLPLNVIRAANTMSWFDFACSYVDMKWRQASPGHRRNAAEALCSVTTAMFTSERGQPPMLLIRRALKFAFNTNNRNLPVPPDFEVAHTWVSHNTRATADLMQPKVIRAVLDAISTNLDGRPAAPSTIRRKRMTLTNALDYAVENELLTKNPIMSVKHAVTSRKTRVIRLVDKRAVPNPVQARTLLQAVREVRGSGARLVAFFGTMYYSALRPEEAATLEKANLSIPSDGWGELHLTHAVPEIGEEWTDSRTRAEKRPLKHREADEGRTVPCPPELTALLNEHLDRYGTAEDGRLFVGRRSGGRIGSSVYGRVWAAARCAVFAPEVLAGPLAKTPYDLRHAAVSTWLKAGVEAPRVAEWAGHSIKVLLEVYAKFLDGGEHAARSKIEDALRG